MENARWSSDRPIAGSASGLSALCAPSAPSSGSGAADTHRCMQPTPELAVNPRQPTIDLRWLAFTPSSVEPGMQNESQPLMIVRMREQ